MRLNPDRIEIEVELRRKHMKLLRFSSGGGRSQHLPLEDFEILPPNHLLPELAIISGTAYGDPVYEYLDPPNPVPEDGLSPVVKISHSFEPFDFHRHQTTVVKEAVAEAAGFPGEIVDEVIVPVPSEVFLVLDKLGKPDWKAELRSTKRVAPPQRIDAALLLGMVVAEGFVAVQAQDQEAVENVGRDVLKLSESLGLKDVVQEHCQEILNASKKNHWEIVRVELDKTQKTVRDTMEKRRDQELAHCVSLGGWLRGTEAVTDLITKNYTSDAAELLNQPDIVKHFRKQVGPMGAKSAKLKSIVAGLEEIGHVIGAGDEPPSASGVQTIQGVAARLVKEINTQTQKTK